MAPSTIRPAVSSDGPEWLRMRSALWPSDDHEPVIAAFFAGRRVEPEEVLLAVVGEGVVGMCELAIRRDVPGREGRRTGFVEGLFVEPGARRGSVARDLLTAARDWSRNKGCEAFGSDRDDRFILDPKFGTG